MPTDTTVASDLASDLAQRVIAAVQIPWWTKFDFWVATILGLVGGVFSILGYVAAQRAAVAAETAKRAAQHAAESVKVQTVVVELHEIALKLTRLEQDITYFAARDLLAEQTLRLRRLIAPFADKQGLKKTNEELLTKLSGAKAALASMAPQEGVQSAAPPAIYFAIEGPLSDVSALIGEMIGMHETTLGTRAIDEKQPGAT